MAVKNSLVSAQAQSPKQTFSAFMTQDAIRNRINTMIGSKDGPRFISSIVSAVATNPALSECDYPTIFSAALLGESLKLSPSPQLGQFYMVPFKDKKNNRTVATFVLGYKGYIQLAIRSGYYRKINVLPIKEGELVRFDPLEEVLEVNLIEDEETREVAPTIGYYAFFEYHNGFRKAMYWSKKKMLIHADKFSSAFSIAPVKARDPKYNKVSFADFEAGKVKDSDMWLYSSFWYKDFDDMACKTMLRQLISRWGIMSIELQTAYEKDEAFLDMDGNAAYVDNWEEAGKDTPEDQPAPEVIDAEATVIEEGDPDPAQESFFND